MPVTTKTTSALAKLGDISTFEVSSSAVPSDASDSSGSVPTLSTTFANGTATEYLVGESLTLATPSVGTFKGEVVNHNKAPNSATYSLSVDSIMARLNSELRAYPLADYSSTPESPYLPLFSLEYWTQQCGLFFSQVNGDVLLYQSGYGHFGLFAKDYTRPLRAVRSMGVGGTDSGIYDRYDRIWTGFGYSFDAIASFPKDKSLAVRIPAVGSSERTVFGADIDLVGTGHTADITWQLRGTAGAKPAIRLAIDSEQGFKLQTANGGGYTTRVTSNVPKGDLYSVYISVSQSSTTATRLSLKVFNRAGMIIDDQTVLPTGTGISGNIALTSVAYHGYPGGSGDEMVYGNMFVSRMPATPLKRIEEAKVLVPGSKGTRFMVGFSGNVWEHVKQYCSIYHLDIGLVNGKLTIAPRQRDVTVGASYSEIRTTIQNREQARNVEVTLQNHKATGSTPAVLWKADSVYQVAVGEIQEFTVQTPHSILETSQPVCVSGINPFPYVSGAGQYVVTGSDGYIVSPTFWRDQGGSITTDTTNVEGEIKITIKGPDFDSPRAPYRISEGDAGRPALYVTGLGVLSTPEKLVIGTGKSRAAKDIGVSVDSPFVGTVKQAYDVAVEAAKTFATPETSVAISEPIPYDGVSKMGASPAGAILKMGGNILRLVSVSQSNSQISGTAVQHNTIYQLKRSFTGMTIGQQKAWYAGKTIKQVNLKPLKRVN